jgi:hypothetical protein
MFGLILVSSIFVILGVLGGKFLASKGVTINLNIENPQYQKWILIILSIVPVIVLFLVWLDKLKLTQKVTIFIPDIILLYFGEYLYDLVIVIGCFVLGLLIGLELFSQGTSETKTQLFIALGVISFVLSLLIYQILPIIGQLKEPQIIDNYIVLQTTDFTCAPASIATLGRLTGKHPQLTEKEVTFLANTTRLGTSTLAEIRALKKLDLNPQFRRNLTVDDLGKINQFAVLHVREPIGRKLINHAVVLLSVDREKQVVKIANPLYGIQYKSYEQMKEYWYGEAVFIRD